MEYGMDIYRKRIDSPCGIICLEADEEGLTALFFDGMRAGGEFPMTGEYVHEKICAGTDGQNDENGRESRKEDRDDSRNEAGGGTEGTEQNPACGAEHRTACKTENRTEHRTGNRIECATERKTEYGAENRTGHATERKTEYGTENRTECATERKTEHGTQYRSCVQEQILLQAEREVTEYFRGERSVFEVPLHLKGTEFQLKVWNALRQIPYGETRSYSEVAQMIGNPQACRAVGGANNRNPVLLMVPCHRVIGKNGNLVGFAGGLDVKQRLLDFERGESCAGSGVVSPVSEGAEKAV